MRVVASLTTIPGRYAKLLRTLRSLKEQDYPLDAIYLAIPQESRRLKQPYPIIPNEIAELCTVVPCDYDYGPITKLMGALISESDPSTIIFTFDDDIVYSPRLVSSMLIYQRRFPDSAIGSSGILLKYGFPFYSTISNCSGSWNRVTGFDMPEDGRSVDALCGFSSVLYLRKFFPSKQNLYEKFLKYPLMDSDVYMNDDIMISAYLSQQKVDRRIVPHIPPTNDGKIFDPNIDGLDENEISYHKLEFLKRFRNSINKVKEWGFYSNNQMVSFYETIGGRVFMVICILIIFLITIYIMFTQLKM